MALVHGTPVADDRVALRIQSSCAYGEILNSVDCDCRGQLEETYRIFHKEGRGVLIYLNQEGRGAGLLPKANAYHCQQTLGLDTVDAYERLGLPADSRNYQVAADVLNDLGLHRLQLLTNNPRKFDSLRAAHFDVEQESLLCVTPQNAAYLNTKRTKLGHLIDVSEQSVAAAATLGRPL